MKRRDWFKCFLALPFISVLKTEAKEKEINFPKQGVNSFEYHGSGWRYGLYSDKSFVGDVLNQRPIVYAKGFYSGVFKNNK